MLAEMIQVSNDDDDDDDVERKVTAFEALLRLRTDRQSSSYHTLLINI